MRSERIQLWQLILPLSLCLTSACGNLVEARRDHQMTPVAWNVNGNVRLGALVTGGIDGQGNPRRSAELFDANSRTFRLVGDMFSTRVAHVQLKRGVPNHPWLHAVVFGGDSAYVEHYLPDDCAFKRVGALKRRRSQAAVSPVANSLSQYLVTGGKSVDPTTSLARSADDTAELIAIQMPTVVSVSANECSASASTPNTGGTIAGAFANSTVINMGVPRVRHTASSISPSASWPLGGVLVVGGHTTETRGQIFDARTSTFHFTQPRFMIRFDHTATVLNDGAILVVGGIDGSGRLVPLAELYNPHSDTMMSSPALRSARRGHTATLLPDGRVLIAGGFANGRDVLRSTEIYNPVSRAFQPGPNLSQGRALHAAALIGREVLFTGGQSGDVLNNAETITIP